MNLEDLYRLLRSGHVQAQGIVDTLDAPLLVLDRSLNVIQVNRAFCATFKVSRDETLDRPFLSLGNGQWDIPELRKLLLEVIPRSAAVVGYEVTNDFPALGPRTMLVTARRLVHPDDISTTMLVAFEDVTDRRHASDEKDILLQETRHRMKNLLGTMRAVANLTSTAGRTAEEYKKAFLGRFQAVMEAQDLSFASGPELDFERVLCKATDLIGDRVEITAGPAVTLPRSKVGSLGLILHEMVTNAMSMALPRARKEWFAFHGNFWPNRMAEPSFCGGERRAVHGRRQTSSEGSARNSSNTRRGSLAGLWNSASSPAVAGCS